MSRRRDVPWRLPPELDCKYPPGRLGPDHIDLFVNTIPELLDSAKAIPMLPKPKGKKFCVLTEAAGPGIICMDEIISAGVLKPAFLSQKTKRKLKELLPPMAMICQPAS